MKNSRYLKFDNRIVILGYGSIGRGILDLILRHIEINPAQIIVIAKEQEYPQKLRDLGMQYHCLELARENYQEFLFSMLHENDFLLNVSVDVSSLALIKLCREKQVLYLDTCIEPWKGGYTDSIMSPAARTNYALRESVLALKEEKGTCPTALVTHGANPGLISHFVKQALINLARDTGHYYSKIPETQSEWATFANELQIKVMHIAERDTQVANTAKKIDEFVNTWSVEGLLAESLQPSESGWGTHERHFPIDACEHEQGTKNTIYLQKPGASVRVRSWTPSAGAYHGFLITHAESISLSDYFSIKDGEDLVYRPTVCYAYHPCNDTVLSLHELAGLEWKQQKQQRILRDEITEGSDELGILLMGNPAGAYWYGSQLSIQEARRLAPENSATSMQVVIGVLAGMIWVINNPEEGIVEPEQIDYRYILDIASPYLGNLAGYYTHWTPLQGRDGVFTEDLDKSDPWQFLNIRVS